MVPDSIKSKIIDVLDTIEKAEQVKIFYACESGSRAWGFPSTDSDFDVRFLYIHPAEWYLSIDEKKDVIEQPIDNELDISGWEIRKALKLFRKSNPPLLEWLQSPIIYAERYSIAQSLKDLLPDYYSPVSCLYHYLHMAQGNFKEYLQGELVWTKKYFYVLRPLLACLWIENDFGPVAMQFEELVNRTVKSDDLKKEIEILLIKKKNGEELSWGPQNLILNDFISTEMLRIESAQFDAMRKRSGNDKLNELLRKALIDAWK
jgi:uncharacterized protein